MIGYLQKGRKEPSSFLVPLDCGFIEQLEFKSIKFSACGFRYTCLRLIEWHGIKNIFNSKAGWSRCIKLQTGLLL